MNTNTTSSSASKKIVKREARKEVRRELRGAKAGLKKAHKPQQQRRPSARTRVVGTGVVAERFTGIPPRRVLASDGRSCEYRSTDFVGTVSVNSTNAIGDVLFTQALSPLLVSSTRLALEAAQWERYHVRDWRFNLQALHGTLIDGQVIAFVDPDPIDTWANTPLNMNKAAAQFDAIPDNVWKHFETDLPIVPGVADFYTNPTTASDMRLSQAGTLRVVYAGGCVFPSGTTKINLFNVYQTVDVRFYQPELSLSTSSPAVGKAKTSSPTASNVLNAASIASGIPISITSSGVNIDTGSLGSNNLVAEIAVMAKNTADVAASFGVDLGSIPGALDSIVQAVRLPERGQDVQEEAISQVLLPGDQSWSLNAGTFGLQNVNLQEATLNLFPVPSSITTLGQALLTTKQRKIKATTIPNSSTAGVSWNAGIPASSGLDQFAAVVGLVGSYSNGITSGFTPYYQSEVSTGGSQELTITWVPSAIGDVIVFDQSIGYPAFGSSNTTLSPSNFNVDAPVNCTLVSQRYIGPFGGSNASGQFLRQYFTVTSLGTCTVHLPDINWNAAAATLVNLDIVVYPNGPWSITLLNQLNQVEKLLLEPATRSSSREAKEQEKLKKVSANADELERLSPEDSDSEDEEGFCSLTQERNARKVTVVSRKTPK